MTLPLVWPSIAVSVVLVAFLGFELFGLPYVLGDQDGRLVLATHLYKFNTLLVTLPLVLLQRRMLRSAQRCATIRGKAAPPHLVPLAPWKWVALAGPGRPRARRRACGGRNRDRGPVFGT